MEMYTESPAEDRNKIPTPVFKDGVKWLIVPAKIILDSLTIWPERQNTITTILNYVCVFSYVFFALGNLYHVLYGKDVDNAYVTLLIFFIIAAIESASRVALLSIYKKRFAKILSKFYFEFWPSDFVGNDLHRAMGKKANILFIYWLIYAASAQFGAFLRVTLSHSIGGLPFGATYPFAWQKSPYYEMMYVWQSFFVTIMPLTACALDILLATLLLNCGMQFKMLSIYLKRNFEEAVQRIDSEGSTRAREVVLYCIKRHKKLIIICKEIDELFTYFILIQYLFSAGTICLACLMATVAHDLGAAFSYIFGHMCEIFIFCYLANELIVESTGLSNAVYECGWHLTYNDNDLRKSLLMIMIRSQKPILMSAGGFGYLSLSSFIKIIQFSFSVYTLLKTLMDKQRSEE